MRAPQETYTSGRAVHSLRHTVGADLRKRGADIRDIQDVLRHADIGTTQIYTHMAREELRKKLIFPAVRGASAGKEHL